MYYGEIDACGAANPGLQAAFCSMSRLSSGFTAPIGRSWPPNQSSVARTRPLPDVRCQHFRLSRRIPDHTHMKHQLYVLTLFPPGLGSFFAEGRPTVRDR